MGGLYVDFGMINADNVEQVSVSVVVARLSEITTNHHVFVTLYATYYSPWMIFLFFIARRSYFVRASFTSMREAKENQSIVLPVDVQ